MAARGLNSRDGEVLVPKPDSPSGLPRLVPSVLTRQTLEARTENGDDAVYY